MKTLCVNKGLLKRQLVSYIFCLIELVVMFCSLDKRFSNTKIKLPLYARLITKTYPKLQSCQVEDFIRFSFKSYYCYIFSFF